VSNKVDFSGFVKNYSEGVLFVQTATGTVANTTTETALTSTGVGTLTLPANFFIAGRTIRVIGYGYHSSVSGTIRIKVKFGSTVILDTTALSTGNNTNNLFQLYGDITCRTTGASGTVFGQGIFTEGGGSPKDFEMVNTSTITIDTTSSQAVSVTCQWQNASASNTTSMSNFTLERIY
jgi:hypothetical protein